MDTEIGGIVLAGGRSIRLGRDKASEALLGVPMLQRAAAVLAGLVNQVVIVHRAGQALPALDLPVPWAAVADAYPDTGPLGGVATGLAASEAERCIVVACDMPLLQPALLTHLVRASTAHDGAVAVNEAGLPEPLCAVYARTALPAIGQRLAEGRLSVSSFFELCDIRRVFPEEWYAYDPRGLSFVGTNTEDELAAAERLLLGTGH